jgi:hypothetical protein
LQTGLQIFLGALLTVEANSIVVRIMLYLQLSFCGSEIAFGLFTHSVVIGCIKLATPFDNLTYEPVVIS